MIVRKLVLSGTTRLNIMTNQVGSEWCRWGKSKEIPS